MTSRSCGKTLSCLCAPLCGLTAAARHHVCHAQMLAEPADALTDRSP